MEVITSDKIVHTKPDRIDYPFAASAKLFHTKQLFLSSEKVEPGKKASSPHFHQSIDEIIYVLRGELHAYEGEKMKVLGEGDAICFYANSKELHYLENQTSSEAEFLVFRRSTTSEDVVY
ncbi:MAG: cupin domain-containing protein [Halobacteriovoraceae bacterium]|nr:cupin domain-containing protein [Halobacteriovoraceae bacterium]